MREWSAELGATGLGMSSLFSCGAMAPHARKSRRSGGGSDRPRGTIQRATGSAGTLRRGASSATRLCDLADKCENLTAGFASPLGGSRPPLSSLAVNSPPTCGPADETVRHETQTCPSASTGQPALLYAARLLHPCTAAARCSVHGVQGVRTRGLYRAVTDKPSVFLRARAGPTISRSMDTSLLNLLQHQCPRPLRNPWRPHQRPHGTQDT